MRLEVAIGLKVFHEHPHSGVLTVHTVGDYPSARCSLQRAVLEAQVDVTAISDTIRYPWFLWRAPDFRRSPKPIPQDQ